LRDLDELRGTICRLIRTAAFRASWTCGRSVTGGLSKPATSRSSEVSETSMRGSVTSKDFEDQASVASAPVLLAPARDQSSIQRRKARTLLCPPNPKEFESATSTCSTRAVFAR
jgi:hypothetical protein